MGIKYTHDDVVNKVCELVGAEYSIVGEYKGANTTMLIKHNTCDNEFEMTWGNFRNGQRCPKCSHIQRIASKTKTHSKFVKEVYGLVGNEYSVLGEYVKAKTKVLIKHGKCGNEYLVTPSDFKDGKRCPKCRQSKGERSISDVLDSLYIDYKEQYKFDECRNIRPLPFDFAVFDGDGKLMFLIEYDGEQHFKDVKYFKYTLDEIKNRDAIKDKYCEDNNIKLVRIPYWADIDEILVKSL